MMQSGLDDKINFWDLNDDLKFLATINPAKSNGKPTSCKFIFFSNDGKYLYGITNSSEIIGWKLDVIKEN